MKTEFSSGGVIVKKFHRSWKVLLLKDMSGNWTFPKGLVEKGEKEEHTAIREIREEVGLTGVRLVAPIERIEYYYHRRGLIKKTVRYFLFVYEGSETPVGQADEGIGEVSWFSFPVAYKTAGYAKTNVPLLRKAYALLRKHL